MRLLADDVGYVEASIYNVWTNLLIGAALASLVMFLFLPCSCFCAASALR
jgi:multidrug efflux pump subunit AcrB